MFALQVGFGTSSGNIRQFYSDKWRAQPIGDKKSMQTCDLTGMYIRIIPYGKYGLRTFSLGALIPATIPGSSRRKYPRPKVLKNISSEMVMYQCRIIA